MIDDRSNCIRRSRPSRQAFKKISEPPRLKNPGGDIAVLHFLVIAQGGIETAQAAIRQSENRGTRPKTANAAHKYGLSDRSGGKKLMKNLVSAYSRNPLYDSLVTK